ncbi:hypothetical protein [Alkalicoccobacillus porphyridii]|uniref:Uncharacterized protein n=1 Tax=Alkalicoccobacillus porphyridii TaxID=2597270 RepID=A0A553ZVP6_9BACI|nr:hypothetical protein [Alkalicoccobacillus porphyridii]TSB45551.1 hypothetical protein FN960_15385 [Alkalicoccobacillus porphyridii]
MKTNPRLPLMNVFEGYVRNYRSLNLEANHHVSMFTLREIEYFCRLGDMLGFISYIEDARVNGETESSRRMDMSWWKWDARKDQENYIELALHLERESNPKKDLDTVEKLFVESAEGYHPTHVIGIQYVTSEARVEELNQLVKQRNGVQQSHVLMVYRYVDPLFHIECVAAYTFSKGSITEVRKAYCQKDQAGFWQMCFEEEYEARLTQV